MHKPNRKILFLDIETKPAIAYVWGLWDVNISLDQIAEPGGTLCVGAKWLGGKETFLYSEWEHGMDGMLKATHALLSEADAVVTYNGDRFDLPKLMGNFLINGMLPPPPPTSIDVLKAVKKLGFQSNKLAFVGPFLKVGAKVKHEGMKLWTAVMDGDVAARKRMANYCIGDVKLLEQVYKKILPYIRNHPHLGSTEHDRCGACGSGKLSPRGYRRTKAFKIQRLRCDNCGSWSDGPRRKANG
jgi:RNase_H superfamily